MRLFSAATRRSSRKHRRRCRPTGPPQDGRTGRRACESRESTISPAPSNSSQDRTRASTSWKMNPLCAEASRDRTRHRHRPCRADDPASRPARTVAEAQGCDSTGWAVESRVYAEDPFRNFLPSTGRLVKYRPPPESRSAASPIRNDTGVQEGGEISHLLRIRCIAEARDRTRPRAPRPSRRSSAVLHAFDVDGIRHTPPFPARR